MRLLIPIFALLAAVSQAQVGPQADQLPACIKTCDPAAIASVNCTNADQYCHCVRQNGILANITVCAEKVCNSPSASLYTFTTLFGQVCARFNISVPIIGSNITGTAAGNNTATATSTPRPSAVTYTGDVAQQFGGYCASSIVLLLVSVMAGLV